MEWKDVIRTGADKLIHFLAGKGEVSIEEAAHYLGIDPKLLEVWVSALEKEHLIKRVYKPRGVFISLGEENIAKASEKFEEIKKDLRDKLKDIDKSVKLEEREAKTIKENLRKIGQIIQKDLAESKAIKKEIQEIEAKKKEIFSEMEALSEKLKKSMEKASKITKMEEGLENKIKDIEKCVELLIKMKDFKNGKILSKKIEKIKAEEKKIHRILGRIKEYASRVMK